MYIWAHLCAIVNIKKDQKLEIDKYINKSISY